MCVCHRGVRSICVCGCVCVSVSVCVCVSVSVSVSVCMPNTYLSPLLLFSGFPGHHHIFIFHLFLTNVCVCVCVCGQMDDLLCAMEKVKQELPLPGSFR